MLPVESQLAQIGEALLAGPDARHNLVAGHLSKIFSNAPFGKMAPMLRHARSVSLHLDTYTFEDASAEFGTILDWHATRRAM